MDGNNNVSNGGTAARPAERPAMDGRAGRSEADLLRHGWQRRCKKTMNRAMARAAANARPWMAGPDDPKSICCAMDGNDSVKKKSDSLFDDLRTAETVSIVIPAKAGIQLLQ